MQPFHLLPSRNISRRISLTWLFPHRCWHARWPVDVTELLHQFCCWTLNWLPHHWVWLHRGCWCYRNLIDWLIYLQTMTSICWSNAIKTNVVVLIPRRSGFWDWILTRTWSKQYVTAPHVGFFFLLIHKWLHSFPNLWMARNHMQWLILGLRKSLWVEVLHP